MFAFLIRKIYARAKWDLVMHFEILIFLNILYVCMRTEHIWMADHFLFSGK